MKILRFIFFTLVVCNCKTGYSQTNIYHPFPQNSEASWYYEWVNYNFPNPPTYQYRSKYWSGDTIINSKTYTKEYIPSGPMMIYQGGIRQNIATQEAFYIDNQGIEHNISFNQNASIGDTLTVWLPEFCVNDSIFRIDNIYSIPVLGNYRKVFDLIPAGNYCLSFSFTDYHATYVSGLGIIRKSGLETVEQVLCHTADNNLVYSIFPHSSCALNNEDLPTELTFKLFPNPTSGQIKLNHLPKNVRLVSSDGKEINANTYFLNEDILDISSCASGIYFAYFEFDSGEVVRKIVKQ